MVELVESIVRENQEGRLVGGTGPFGMGSGEKTKTINYLIQARLPVALSGRNKANASARQGTDDNKVEEISYGYQSVRVQQSTPIHRHRTTPVSLSTMHQSLSPSKSHIHYFSHWCQQPSPSQSPSLPSRPPQRRPRH